MNAEKWIEMLSYLQEFRSQLETWGITNGVLIVIAVVSGVVFLFSLREVLGWFLRVPHLRAEIKSLNQQLTDAKQLLTEMNGKLSETKPTALVIETAQEEEDDSEESSPDGRPQFRLDH
jgi:hypothetical protein